MNTNKYLDLIIFIFLSSLLISGSAFSLKGQCTTKTYYMQRAAEDYSQGNLQSAISLYEKEIYENPKNGFAHISLAALKLELKEYGSALTSINRGIPLLPKENQVLVAQQLRYRGDIKLALNDTISALDDYTLSINLYPEDLTALLHRANLYFNQRKYDLAEKDFNKIIELEPGNTAGYLGIAQNNIAEGNYEKAISHLALASKLNESNPVIMGVIFALKAEAYFKQGKWNETTECIINSLSANYMDSKAFHLMLKLPQDAITSIKARLKIQEIKDPSNSIWPYFMGELLENNNDYEEAINFYNKAFKIKNLPGYARNISNCYYELGNYNKALEFINKAITIFPEAEDFYYAKAKILNEIGNYEDALTQIDKYIAMVPEDEEAYHHRGWINQEKGDFKQAINDYTVAIILDPEYTYSYLNRGHCYYLLGLTKLATDDFQKVIYLDTTPNADPCAHFAYFYLGQSEKAKEFLNFCLENANEEDYVGILYDAACLYSLLGDTETSLSYLRESLKRGFRRFAHIKVDKDLDNVRNSKQFVDLINEFQ